MRKVGILILAATAAIAGAAPSASDETRPETFRPYVDVSAIDVTTGPPPSFVVDHEIPNTREAEATNGVRRLLVDSQSEVRGPDTVAYTRFVSEATTYTGVQGVATLFIDFDPSFQRVEINHARVVRDGAVEDRVGRMHVDVLRLEELLGQQLITGLVRATVRLDDVRVHDLVDIGYTIYGASPGYDGRSSLTIVLGSSEAVESAQFSATIPGDATWRVLGPSVELVERRRRGRRVLETPAGPREPITPEFLTPSWDFQVPALVVTDFADWSDVAAWGERLFRVPQTVDPEVSALAASIAADNDGVGARVAAALRFVQNDVRYFGVQLGDGGYVPVAPENTLRTRSGDCKAKTLLFLTLLDQMGIRADAVLVSAWAGQSLDTFPPTPVAFDHVIARVRVDDHDYWVDPTAMFQGGDLEHVTQADFGYGLPLVEGQTELVSMTRPRPTDPEVVFREAYSAFDDLEAPVTVRLEIAAERGAADAFRAVIAEDQLPEYEEQILENYRSQYGEAEYASGFDVDDDLAANRILLRSEITLAEPYDVQNDGSRYQWNINAYSIQAPAVDFDVADRKHAVALLHRTHARHEVHIDLPRYGGWDQHTEENSVENAAFRASYRAAMSDAALDYFLELEPLAYAVSPEQYEAAVEDAGKVNEFSRYHIWRDLAAPGPLAEPVDMTIEGVGTISLDPRRVRVGEDAAARTETMRRVALLGQQIASAVQRNEVAAEAAADLEAMIGDIADPRLRSQALVTLLFSAEVAEDWTRVAALSMRVVDSLEDLEEPGFAELALSQVGEIAWHVQDSEQRARIYQRAFEIAERRGLSATAVQLASRRAVEALEVGDATASEYVEHTFRLAEQAEPDSQVVFALISLGHEAILDEENALAARALDRAIGLASADGLELERAEALRARADLAALEDDRATACTAYAQSRALYAQFMPSMANDIDFAAEQLGCR